MPSRQSDRRTLSKLRSTFSGRPWNLDPSFVGSVLEAMENRDLNAVKNLASTIDMAAEKVNGTGIALIPVVGVLQENEDWFSYYTDSSTYSGIETSLKDAAADEKTSRVVLYVDSPGGEAIGCKRIADLVKQLGEKKPIIAYVQGGACSAAYYIASACQKILATPDSLVGCIGTIYPHVESSKMLEEWGVKFTVFTNAESPAKGYGNSYEPLTDKSTKSLQEFVDSFGQPFISDVARFRAVGRDKVLQDFGQGESYIAPLALKRGMIDGTVADLESAIAQITTTSSASAPSNSNGRSPTPRRDTMRERSRVSGRSSTGNSTMKKIKQLMKKMGLLNSANVDDKAVFAKLKMYFGLFGVKMPRTMGEVYKQLRQLQGPQAMDDDKPENNDDEPDNMDDEEHPENNGEDDPIPSDDDDLDNEEDNDDLGAEGDDPVPDSEGDDDTPESRAQRVRTAEYAEARQEIRQQELDRLANLRASGRLLNQVANRTVITNSMVTAAFNRGETPQQATKKWGKAMSNAEPPLNTTRVNVTGQGSDRFTIDAVDALLYKSSGGATPLSQSAENLVRKPLWAIAGECLQMRRGQNVDLFGDREMMVRDAMEMNGTQRVTSYSEKEKRHYIGATGGGPASRPGDFPNILSNLANKYLDTIELDEFSYPEYTAILPAGLNDYKPAPLINRGTMEELDVVKDDEKIQQIGIAEEVLSYIFLQRFANKWGWTVELIANDDLNAFAEGMLGLQEAWGATQNRLCLEHLTGNAALLDGNLLFSDRGGTLGNNDRAAGNPPSDTEWGAMEELYADIKGVDTEKRVRGSLDTIFTPTGTTEHEAVRTFAPLNILEPKAANTTGNVGIFRDKVKILSESELRRTSNILYYGFRKPKNLRTATIIRGYFNGMGEGGRRERWYDPERQTTWTSITGAIATAVKNWRYAVRNAGTGA